MVSHSTLGDVYGTKKMKKAMKTPAKKMGITLPNKSKKYPAGMVHTACTTSVAIRILETVRP